MTDTIIKLKIPFEELFSLADTLACGQCFRWFSTADGWFEGVVEGRLCRVKQEADGILLQNALDGDLASGFWEDYFDLNTSYASIRRRLSKSRILARAAAYAPGIRILRQYPWETLVTFIISQNNNIPRIQGIIARLCEQFGEALAPKAYAFPSAEKLAGLTEAELAPLRSGYRAAHILDAAQQVASGRVDLEQVRSLPLEEARAVLRTIRGVGPKVAECALLYGFARRECFPMDVWMKKAMRQLFPRGLPQCAAPYAGIAQQYIFHYARVGGALER